MTLRFVNVGHRFSESDLLIMSAMELTIFFIIQHTDLFKQIEFKKKPQIWINFNYYLIETRIIIYLFTVNRISNGLGFNNECLFIFLLSIIVFKYTHICFFLSCRILSSNTSGAVGGLAYTLNYNGHIKRVRIACF